MKVGNNMQCEDNEQDKELNRLHSVNPMHIARYFHQLGRTIVCLFLIEAPNTQNKNAGLCIFCVKELSSKVIHCLYCTRVASYITTPCTVLYCTVRLLVLLVTLLHTVLYCTVTSVASYITTPCTVH